MKYIKGFLIACLHLVLLPAAAFLSAIINFIPTIEKGGRVSYAIKPEEY